MANFEAKEKAKTPTTEQAPGSKTPEADKDGLCFMGDGRFYTFETDHSERETLRPGYFDNIVRGNGPSYKGALILYTCRGGKKDPEDWSTGLIRIATIRGTRGADQNERTKVAIVARFHTATLVGHDGEAEPATAKAA